VYVLLHNCGERRIPSEKNARARVTFLIVLLSFLQNLDKKFVIPCVAGHMFFPVQQFSEFINNILNVIVEQM
jgi:hypothetical protein